MEDGLLCLANLAAHNILSLCRYCFFFDIVSLSILFLILILVLSETQKLVIFQSATALKFYLIFWVITNVSHLIYATDCRLSDFTNQIGSWLVMAPVV